MAGKVNAARWLLYLLYGLVLTGVLLYIRFPAAKVEAFLLQKVEAALPGSDCSYKALHYNFPFSMVVDELRFTGKRDNRELLLLENLVLTPAAAGLGRSFAFRTTLYEGSAEGRLNIFPLKKRFSFSDVRVERANVALIASLQTGFRREIKGFLSGTAAYEGSWVEGASRSGRGAIKLTDGSLLLLRPILTLRQLEFEQLGMEFSYMEDALKISDGDIKGSPLQADFEGEVRVNEEIPSWQVRLAGNMRVEGNFIKDTPQLLRVYKRMVRQYGKGEELPYRVGGTIGSPRFRFGRE